MIERVESHGKHLHITWDDGLVLHTHLRMSGSWHLYRIGERWRKGADQMRVAIEVPDWVAVCFNAPTVETYREFDRFRHPGFGRLGPDLCTATSHELVMCARRMHEYPDPHATIADVLLDQHVACGVGNVYRSEVLWACEVNPFAEVGTLAPADCVEVMVMAAQMMRANLENSYRVTNAKVPGGLAVYSRNGQRCPRCGDTVSVRRLGEHERRIYWCAGCQVKHAPVVQEPPVELEREMDPHPAAARYLADLPWRRDSLAG